MSNQYSIFDDCFVDSFAGGGGASTGIEMATGHPVDVAINHNEAAIMMHRAMGFPHDYIIDKDVNGKPITRADQVARCGNAVCPAVAEALVRSNLPEYCKRKISDMESLHSVMTS